jgi:hypothetical protein
MEQQQEQGGEERQEDLQKTGIARYKGYGSNPRSSSSEREW